MKWKAGQPWYPGAVMLQQQLLQPSLRVFDMHNARPRGGAASKNRGRFVVFFGGGNMVVWYGIMEVDRLTKVGICGGCLS